MLRAFRSLCWTVFLLLLCGTPALAQSKSQAADSLKKLIADHRSRLHVADSVGDMDGAMFIRLQLAPLVKPKEATTLLQEAAAAASSSDPTTEITVRTQLAEHYEHIGNHRLAYAEAMKVVALGSEALVAQAEESGSRTDRDRASAAADRDSLQRVWTERLADAKAFGSAAEERNQRWMLIAVVTGLAFLITLFVLLYRSGRSNKRIRVELEGLHAEITALKEQRQGNQVLATPSAIVATPPPVQVPVAATIAQPSTAAEIDPIVVEMFRKMGPERLTTLRDARARGDQAKVVRVVHSLKPQLVNFDAAFAELCARITAPAAPENMALWSADLDVLESGIATVLKKLDH